MDDRSDSPEDDPIEAIGYGCGCLFWGIMIWMLGTAVLVALLK